MTNMRVFFGLLPLFAGALYAGGAYANGVADVNANGDIDGSYGNDSSYGNDGAMAFVADEKLPSLERDMTQIASVMPNSNLISTDTPTISNVQTTDAPMVNLSLPDELPKNALIQSPWTTLKSDYQAFYQPERMTKLGLAFVGGGLLANAGGADTTIDSRFSQWYQGNVRSTQTDNIAKISKNFGEGKYLIPLSLVALGSHYVMPNNSVSTLGGDTFRAYAVGAPVVLLSQRALGASRPNENIAQGSKYKPLQDDNSVSGHAFMGAVPFLTLAHHTDEPALKYAAYAASTLTAWSRVNDDKHYLSQAILGWYIAYESVNAVQQSNAQQSGHSKLLPMVAEDKVGVVYHSRW